MKIDRCVYDPPSDENDPQFDLPRGRNMVCVSNVVTRDPSFYEYRKMLQTAYSEAEIVLKDLLLQGFRPHAFLIGAAFTRKMIIDIPQYDLWGIAKKIGLSYLKKIEIDLNVNECRRRIGLYEIRNDDLFELCLLQSQSNQCGIILLAPSENATEKLCKDFYEKNNSNESERIVNVRWHNLAIHACVIGSVFIREVGMFDDIQRGIVICLPRYMVSYDR